MLHKHAEGKHWDVSGIRKNLEPEGGKRGERKKREEEEILSFLKWI